jgi:phosphate transport system substrate-binding protein
MAASAPCFAATATKQPAAKTTAAKKPAAKAKKPALPELVWRGDRATERGFMADLAKQYETDKLGKITMQPFSTISGIDAVHDGSADIAGSARPGIPERTEEAGTIFYPIAWEALVPITSPVNPLDNVTLKGLYDVYLGRLTNWKDLGSAEDAPIDLYAGVAPLDGVEYSFRARLYPFGDQKIAAPRLYLNTAKLEEAVTIDPHSLGFTTLSAVAGNKKIKALKVEGIDPSAATIRDGSYPLYSLLYLAARGDSKNAQEIDKFIQYAKSDAGKAILRKHALVPYDEAEDLNGKNPQRVAFIDSHVIRHAVGPAAPAAAADPPPAKNEKTGRN